MKQDKYMLDNTEGVMKKDNPGKLAKLGKQDTGQIKVREFRKGNEKRTIQRNWQHRVHNTKKKNNPRKPNNYTICIGHHYAQASTYNVNKT